jgi:hypothetical protein
MASRVIILCTAAACSMCAPLLVNLFMKPGLADYKYNIIAFLGGPSLFYFKSSNSIYYYVEVLVPFFIFIGLSCISKNKQIVWAALAAFYWLVLGGLAVQFLL